MSFFSPLLVVFLLQRMTGVMAMECDGDGDIRLDFVEDGETVNQREYRLIQVCLFGQWSYVCSWNFDHQNVDSNVVLQQLQCQNGATTSRGSTFGLTPAYLAQVNCVGVEKRLIDCPRGNSLSRNTCWYKLQVNCTDTDTGSPYANRECDNGQLHASNTTNILYICVNGNWRTLCPSLWGPAQATVACRQLNTGRTVIRSVVNSTTTDPGTPNRFKYHFFCTGKENEITGCSLSDREVNDNLCDENMVATLLCDTEIEVQPPEYVVSTVLIVSTVVQSCTADIRATPHIVQAIDKQAVSTVFMVSTVVQVVSSCTVNIGVTPCNAHKLAHPNTTSRPSSAKQSDGTPLPWVGGVIIGAVLSTVMLIAVLAAVCLWRRKRSHSQHKLPDKNVRERSVSLIHTNDIYNRYSGTPQPYEEYLSKQQQNEPEYSYATHAVETNTYDSVPQQSSGGDDGHYSTTEGVTVVNNTALYSLCAEDVQENGVYSKLSRK